MNPKYEYRFNLRSEIFPNEPVRQLSPIAIGLLIVVGGFLGRIRGGLMEIIALGLAAMAWGVWIQLRKLLNIILDESGIRGRSRMFSPFSVTWENIQSIQLTHGNLRVAAAASEFIVDISKIPKEQRELFSSMLHDYAAKHSISLIPDIPESKGTS